MRKNLKSFFGNDNPGSECREWKTVKEQISIPIDGKGIFLNELQKGDHLLFLYGPNANVHQSFLSFLETGLNNKELCLYVYDRKNNRLDLTNGEFRRYINSGILNLLGLDEERAKMIRLEEGEPKCLAIDYLENKLVEMYKNIQYGKYDTLRILIDFGSLVSHSNISNVISSEKNIARQTIKPFHGLWNERYYKRMQKMPHMIAVSAFSIESLDCEMVRSLLRLHKKAIISTERESVALLPSYTNQDFNMPSIDMISKEAMEDIVKKNLDAIVLSIVQQEPMCGYDIIKTISSQFHVFLSQGTIYPLLHSLERDGILETKMGRYRKKAYCPSKKGKRLIDDKLNNFRKVYEYILGQINK